MIDMDAIILDAMDSELRSFMVASNDSCGTAEQAINFLVDDLSRLTYKLRASSVNFSGGLGFTISRATYQRVCQ